MHTALIVAALIYPNSKLTPGDVLTDDSKVVCSRGYTRDERMVTPQMRKAVFKRYGFIEGKYKSNNYEIDHFISLELGGSNKIENLWPQPYCGDLNARDKDAVESVLHGKVCRGEITLVEAQRRIRTDWVAEYKKLRGVK